MLLEEFEQRTGCYPTIDVYAAIERVHNDYPGDKGDFCAAYKRNDNYMQQRIQREVNLAQINARDNAAALIADYNAKIAKLYAALDAELEWTPYDNHVNVVESDYQDLLTSSGTHIMTDDEAKELLYNQFGFAKCRITILRTAPRYEVNRHGLVRQTGTFDRTPVYNTTDWNYIFFIRGCMSYEFYNDDLRPYYN